MPLVKPNIVISRCFVDAVRYNGARISSSFMDELKNHVNFIPVCPEMEVGLGAPRLPLRLVEKKDGVHMIQQKTERDFTDSMSDFASSFLSGLKDIDGFVLKSKSPSCGIASVKIYASMEKKPAVRRDKGLFAEKVKERYSNLPVESEGRVTDPDIKENFLTAIFSLSEFRNLKKNITSQGKLVDFHTGYKLLFMAFSQSRMRIMGKIVANHEKHPFSSVIESYEREFMEIFTRRANRKSHINVLQHAFGYFSPKITAGEKKNFLSLLQRYKNGDIPLNFLLEIVRVYIARTGDSYLIRQKYFNPYPEELQWR
ncbi:MAG: DUF1722 domain-containing protein [Candidatus Omnitrophica bacterium]|nr:DUF1722 domain-containing protein [Candidatus Omnitrophota bacterium]